MVSVSPFLPEIVVHNLLGFIFIIIWSWSYSIFCLLEHGLCRALCTKQERKKETWLPYFYNMVACSLTHTTHHYYKSYIVCR